jgi:hypothetical protein
MPAVRGQCEFSTSRLDDPFSAASLSNRVCVAKNKSVGCVGQALQRSNHRLEACAAVQKANDRLESLSRAANKPVSSLRFLACNMYQFRKPQLAVIGFIQ